ncbi:MAG: hypothetical protein JWP97_791 [Labilithrix sp.]|nr:hypothetical protein [Labilithrix sp.]
MSFLRRALVVAALACSGCALVLGLGDEPTGGADVPDGALGDGDVDPRDGGRGDGSLDGSAADGAGTLDPTFGDGGIIFVSGPAGGDRVALHGVTVRGSTIYVAGEVLYGDGRQAGLVAEYTAEGLPHPTDSMLLAPPTPNAELYAVAVTEDGPVTAVGRAQNATSPSAAYGVVRSGTMLVPINGSSLEDQGGAFTTTGVVVDGGLAGGYVGATAKAAIWDVSTFKPLPVPAEVADASAILDLKLQPGSLTALFLAEDVIDGAIVGRFKLANVTSDNTFGPGGRPRTLQRPGASTSPRAFDANDAGIFVLAQSIGKQASASAPHDAVVLALHTDGIDRLSSFGDAGEQVLDLGGEDVDPTDVAVDTSSRVLVCGTAIGPLVARGFVVRLGSDGRPDTSFGANGVFVLPQELHAEVAAVALLPGGGILVVGSVLTDDGSADRGFIVKVRP